MEYLSHFVLGWSSHLANADTIFRKHFANNLCIKFLLVKSVAQEVRFNLEVSLVNKLACLTLLMFCFPVNTLISTYYVFVSVTEE